MGPDDQFIPCPLSQHSTRAANIMSDSHLTIFPIYHKLARKSRQIKHELSIRYHMLVTILSGKTVNIMSSQSAAGGESEI